MFCCICIFAAGNKGHSNRKTRIIWTACHVKQKIIFGRYRLKEFTILINALGITKEETNSHFTSYEQLITVVSLPKYGTTLPLMGG